MSEDGFREGCRLFNAGQYFEAHEVWEDVWQPLRGPERDFFRGLIQLAVALKKAHEGNANGTMRLLLRANGLLAPYEPATRGVDVTALRRHIAAMLAEAKAWAHGAGRGLTIPPPRLPEATR